MMSDPFAVECSHCGSQYSFDDYIKLKKRAVKQGQVEKYGYNPVCSKCNKPFHKNKWCITTDIFLNNIDKRLHPKYPQKHIWVSTVHLEFYHHGGIYETMFFVIDQKGDRVYSEMYKHYNTKEDATLGHKLICSKIEKEKKLIIMMKDAC